MLFKLLIIVFILLLIFGAGRIAQLGRGMGEGIRNFKKGIHADDEDADAEDASKSKGGTPSE